MFHEERKLLQINQQLDGLRKIIMVRRVAPRHLFLIVLW